MERAITTNIMAVIAAFLVLLLLLKLLCLLMLSNDTWYIVQETSNGSGFGDDHDVGRYGTSITVLLLLLLLMMMLMTPISHSRCH